MDGIDWASSAMVAARTRLDTATENLANVSTDGFRRCLTRGRMSDRGVEIERFTSNEHGALRGTGRPFDFAIVGNGAFRVVDSYGRIFSTRDGAFTRDRTGALRDDAGRALLGTQGALNVPDGATIDDRGVVVHDGRILDRIRLPEESRVRSGFLESANVDAIGEMVGVLTAQRAFESAEKVVTAIDSVRQKTANDVARVK